jgi:hypothetical protein
MKFRTLLQITVTAVAILFSGIASASTESMMAANSQFLNVLDSPESKDGKLCKDKDVKSWKAIGTRWAAGYDETGKMIAIYDLSFVRTRSRIHFGRFGKEMLETEEVITDIKDGRARVVETPEEQAETDQALRELESNPETVSTVLPAEWHKQMPWKNSTIKELDVSPPAFTLNELATDTNPKETLEAEQKISENLGEAFKVDEFLGQFTVETQVDGTFDINYSPSLMAGTSNPKKIADVACVQRGNRIKLAGATLIKLIRDRAQSLVTAPIAGNILATALNVFDNYQEQKDESHLEMLMEMLDGAQGNEPNSPFAFLTEEERSNAALSVVLSESAGFSSLKWLISRPKKEWAKLLRKNAERAEEAGDWLRRHNRNFVELNPRFAVEGTGDALASLLILPRNKSHKKGPWIAVDYANPDAIRKSRIRKQRELVAVDLASRFVPTFGGIVRAVNNRLVLRPMKAAKLWEARLMAHLEARKEMIASEASQWETELNILDRQKLNPLEVSRKNSLDFASATRARLGIGQ